MEQELADRVEHTVSDASATSSTQAEVVEVVEELLIEEISIDGMCGVY